MKSSEIIVGIGAEGGSIQLLGRHDNGGHWQFARAINDQTPTLLDEEDGGDDIDHSSPWVHSWPEGVALLDRYPWASLVALEVHADFRGRVWEAVKQRLVAVPEHYAEPCRQRWARACHIHTA